MSKSVIATALGASIQESVYVAALRKIADGIASGLLDVKTVSVNDDVINGYLSIEMVLIEHTNMEGSKEG